MASSTEAVAIADLPSKPRGKNNPAARKNPLQRRPSDPPSESKRCDDCQLRRAVVNAHDRAVKAKIEEAVEREKNHQRPPEPRHKAIAPGDKTHRCLLNGCRAGRRISYADPKEPSERIVDEAAMPELAHVCRRCGHGYADLAQSGRNLCAECHQDDVVERAWTLQAQGVDLGWGAPSREVQADRLSRADRAGMHVVRRR